MPLPAEFGTGVVQGHYVDLQGNPMSGLVQFTASPLVLVAATSETIIVPIQLEATLDADGRFSLIVPATDDPDISPVHWTYSVREVFSGFTRKYSLEVQVGSTLDVSTVVQTQDSGGVTVLRGPQGVQGIQGPAGTQGPVGAQGIQGLQGITGPKGDTGPNGPQGPLGPTGAQGPLGPKGDAGTGVTIKGTKTSTAQLPLTGAAGDAYMINGELWTWDGSQWVNVGNIKGPQGDAGPQGPQGNLGPTGATGPKGDTGAQGVQGVQGPTGSQGIQGPQGPLGPGFTYKGIWAAQTAYAARDVVSINGSTFAVIADHTSTATPPNPGTPGPNMVLWAQKGDTGDKGDVGSQGPIGPAGIAADATSTTKGSLRLAGDLAGTADVPTVPALAGLDTRLGTVETTINTTATSASTPNSLAKRDASGRLQVANASVAADVLNKGQADGLYVPTSAKGAASGVAALDASSRVLSNGTEFTQVTAPTTSPAAGKVWLYLDSTTGKLHYRDSGGLISRPASYLGSRTTAPPGALQGDTYYHSGVGCLFISNGGAWKQAETQLVATATARNAISTSYNTLLYEGYKVRELDSNREYTYIDGAWRVTSPLAPVFINVGGTGYDVAANGVYTQHAPQQLVNMTNLFGEGVGGLLQGISSIWLDPQSGAQMTWYAISTYSGNNGAGADVYLGQDVQLVNGRTSLQTHFTAGIGAGDIFALRQYIGAPNGNGQVVRAYADASHHYAQYVIHPNY